MSENCNVILRGESESSAEVTPAHVLSLMMSSENVDTDHIMKMMELQQKWEEREAMKAYVSAIGEFKSDPPTITKNSNVSFGKTNYSHATLGDVSDLIGESLSKYGLSHRWDVGQDDSGLIKVTCIIRHRLGYSEQVSMRALPDNSGGKNCIQAIASAVTYLQRYTLLAVAGMAAGESDDDGRGTIAESIKLISDEQVKEIQSYIDENKKTEAVMKWLSTKGINSLSEIPSYSFVKIMDKIKK